MTIKTNRATHKPRPLRKSLKQVLSECRSQHGDKYNYDHAVYAGMHKKMEIGCRVCGTYFMQIVKVHTHGSGCPTCANKAVGRNSCDTQEEVLTKFKAVHGDTYDYKNVVYVNAVTKVDIGCKECNTAFKQTPNSHLQGTGCPVCGIDRQREAAAKTAQSRPKRASPKRNTLEETIRRFHDAHGDRYDYSQVVLKGVHERVAIGCEEHGTFGQSPASHARGAGCPICGASKTGISNRLSYAGFLDKARAVHGDQYEYDERSYVVSSQKINITCKKHGVFSQGASGHLAGRGCPTCSYIRSAQVNSYSFDTYVEQVARLHNNKYTYAPFTGPLRQTTKINIICPQHGVFAQGASSHKMGRGCPQCKNESISEARKADPEEALARLRLAHKGKYTYEAASFSGWNKQLSANCPEHGGFHVVAASHLMGQQCPLCSTPFVSKGEQDVVDWIRSRDIVVKQSVRGELGDRRHELDMVMYDKGIAVEYNGNFWHSSGGGKSRTYHKDKLASARAAGLRCIMIRDDEWRNKQPIVKSILSHAVGLTKNKIGARKCVIEVVPKKLFASFADSNHMQGRCGATEVLGLYLDNELVCCGAWTKRRGEWELVRFVVKLNTVVCGGFSRLIKHFGKPFYTFCERRLFGGGGYAASGGTYISTTPPDLCYTNGNVVQNRRRFQKRVAAQWMETYDMALTEKVNAENNGWYQLWGCGLDKYVFNT